MRRGRRALCTSSMSAWLWSVMNCGGREEREVKERWESREGGGGKEGEREGNRKGRTDEGR